MKIFTATVSLAALLVIASAIAAARKAGTNGEAKTPAGDEMQAKDRLLNQSLQDWHTGKKTNHEITRNDTKQHETGLNFRVVCLVWIRVVSWFMFSLCPNVVSSDLDETEPNPLPRQSPLKLPLADPQLVVSKHKRQLHLFAEGVVVRTYRIALGANPTGDKVEQGDRRTPEGDFYIDVKNERSKFYFSLGLSYPNSEDAERGLRDQLISRAEHGRIVRAIRNKGRPPWDTALGGEIFIHGGGTQGDWTWGCIAMENADIKELFDALPMGTSVRIEP